MHDDDEVIRRVVAGDSERFRVLVARYQTAVFRFVGSLIADSGEREDVAQEVFLAAFRNLAGYDARRSAFLTWLLAIARNRCINVLKQRKPIASDEGLEAACCQNPHAAEDERELHNQLDRALAALPPEQRTAFVLSEMMQLSQEEISRIEQVPLGTVKSRVSRAKAHLRSVLDQHAENP